jgi:hypothetical protein
MSEKLRGLYVPLETINQMLKEENARLREALESIERDAWETMKEDIEKIARQALKQGKEE